MNGDADMQGMDPDPAMLAARIAGATASDFAMMPASAAPLCTNWAA